MEKLEEQLKIFVEQVATNSAVISEKAVKDYLASKKFQEKINECAADGFSQRFDECYHQIWKLYPNLNFNKLEEDFADEEELYVTYVFFF